MVKGQDLNGKPGGNIGTSTVTIKVRDVNDNLPTLEKEEVVFFLTLFYINVLLVGARRNCFFEGVFSFDEKQKRNVDVHITEDILKSKKLY